MQSGTVLHLALLRKLSSRSPNKDYTSRFRTFRRRQSSNSYNLPQTSLSSRQMFEKYPSTDTVLNFICKSRRSKRKNNENKKKSHEKENDFNLRVSGWSIENEESQIYPHQSEQKKLHALNSNQFKSNQLNQQYASKKRFTFCEDNFEYFINRPIKTAININRQIKTPKENIPKVQNPLIILNVEKQQSLKPMFKKKFTNKENVYQPKFQHTSPSLLTRRRTVSNESYNIKKYRGNQKKTARILQM